MVWGLGRPGFDMDLNSHDTVWRWSAKRENTCNVFIRYNFHALSPVSTVTVKTAETWQSIMHQTFN